MNWINKLERKFGRHVIHNLPVYITIAYAVGFFVDLLIPQVYADFLCLDVSMILKGQVWRLVTWIIQPPSTSVIFIIFALYLYYFIGTSLERAWGSFRFNLYFFSGVILHIIAAFLVHFLLHMDIIMTTEYLNLSLFFAFAALFPDVQMLFMFFIPMKIKWLAYIDGAFFIYTIFMSIVSGIKIGPAYFGPGIAAFVSLLNFLIYFLSCRGQKPHAYANRNAGTSGRRMQYGNRGSGTSYGRGAKSDGASGGKSAYSSGKMQTRHCCTVCGRTEVTNPELEFRYCSKCKGNHEFCSDHLFTHVHIQ